MEHNVGHGASFLLVLAVLSTLTSPLEAGNCGVIFGSRAEPDGERLPVTGIQCDLGKPEWIVRPEAGVQVAFNPLYGGSARELHVGLIKWWELGKARPFLGAGIAWDRAMFGPNRSATNRGTYFHGGILWHVKRRLGAGIDARFRAGPDLEFDGFTEKANYSQVSFVLGWNW